MWNIGDRRLVVKTLGAFVEFHLLGWWKIDVFAVFFRVSIPLGSNVDFHDINRESSLSV